MGITDHSIMLINEVLSDFPQIKNVVELGDQMLYINSDRYGAYADIYYRERGLQYTCIDLNGLNNAIVWDMSERREVTEKFSLLTDFGFSEHVSDSSGTFSWDAIYNCWKTKHDLLEVGGVMINENPKTGNWENHGRSYYTEQFYRELQNNSGYKILNIGEHPAMGNTTDGWNVYCTLLKESEEFPSLEQFKTFSVKQS